VGDSGSRADVEAAGGGVEESRSRGQSQVLANPYPPRPLPPQVTTSISSKVGRSRYNPERSSGRRLPKVGAATAASCERQAGSSKQARALAPSVLSAHLLLRGPPWPPGTASLGLWRPATQVRSLLRTARGHSLAVESESIRHASWTRPTCRRGGGGGRERERERREEREERGERWRWRQRRRRRVRGGGGEGGRPSHRRTVAEL